MYRKTSKDTAIQRGRHMEIGRHTSTHINRKIDRNIYTDSQAY